MTFIGVSQDEIKACHMTWKQEERWKQRIRAEAEKKLLNEMKAEEKNVWRKQTFSSYFFCHVFFVFPKENMSEQSLRRML